MFFGPVEARAQVVKVKSEALEMLSSQTYFRGESMQSIHDELSELVSRLKKARNVLATSGEYSELRTLVYEAERTLAGTNDHKKSAMIHVIKDEMKSILQAEGGLVNEWA